MMESSLDDITPLSASYHLLRSIESPAKGTRCGCIIYEHFANGESQGSGDNLDYDILVTGGTEGEIIIWRLLQDGTVGTINAFIGHQGTVMDIISCSLPGSHIEEPTSTPDDIYHGLEASLTFYTCGRDYMIHRFNMGGARLLTLAGHDNTVCSLHEFSNGERLVSGSWDGTAIVWNAIEGTMEYRLRDDLYKHSVYCSSLSDGTIVTGMTNGDICFWKEKRLEKVTGAHGGVVRGVSIQDGTIITCANDCSVRMFSENMDPIFNIPVAHENFVYDVRHSKKFGVFFTSSEDKTVGVWNKETGELIQTLVSDSSIWKVVESRLNILVLIPLNGNISIWQLNPQIPPVCTISRGANTVEVPTTTATGTPKLTASFEMTKFSKINVEKALEYLVTFNGSKTPELAITDREVATVKQILTTGTIPNVDYKFVFKLTQWPVEERIPVFDFLKVFLLDPGSHKLFKGRSSGYQIFQSLCSTIHEAKGNRHLVVVSLQLLANMLVLTLPRTILFNHFDRTIEAINEGGKIGAKMVQQSHSACIKNLVIATLDDIYERSEKILESMQAALAVMVSTAKEAEPWVAAVILCHCRSLETMIYLEKRVAPLVTKMGLFESMNDLATKALPDSERKATEEVINRMKLLVS